MDALYVLSAGLEIFCAVIAGILMIGCLFDHERKRNLNRIFFCMLVVDIVINVTDACIWLWADSPDNLWLLKIMMFSSYGLGCFILALFSNLITSYIREYAKVPKWIIYFFIGLTTVMMVMWFISLFNGMYYYWDEDGICQMGNLFMISQLFGVIFLIVNIVLVFVYRKVLRKKDCEVLIGFNLLPLLSFIVTILLEWEATPLYISITISLLLYYTIIHIEHGQRIAEQKTKLVKQELELESGRTAIMLSQIQPHFLYNSLTAIAQLCTKDSQRAKEIILSFSDYLRQNMNSLNQKEPISFTIALEHLKTYLSIEKVRFGDLLNVVYDIEVKNFMIPALCLQPVVENAVKHGIRRNEDGGTVTISTREETQEYVITVTDDGVGFNPDVQPDDGKTHIGISNVKKRLAFMVKGTMEIKSEIGKGTTVKITIPREK